MKIFLMILIFLLALILQLTNISFLEILDVSPNLILALILALVVLKGFSRVWWIILLFGFFIDLYSGLPFGLINLSMVVSSYLIDWFNKNIFSAVRFWVKIGLVILGNLIYDLLIFIFSELFDFELILNLKYLSIELAYNLLIAIVVLYGFKKIFYQK